MDTTEKVLLIGGIAIGGWLLLSMAKKSALNSAAALNQPGLTFQPSMPSLQQQSEFALGNLLSSGSSALGNWIGSLGSGNGANDPGLDGEGSGYDEPNYSYSATNSYSSGNTGMTAISDNNDGSDDFFA